MAISRRAAGGSKEDDKSLKARQAMELKLAQAGPASDFFSMDLSDLQTKTNTVTAQTDETPSAPAEFSFNFDDLGLAPVPPADVIAHSEKPLQFEPFTELEPFPELKIEQPKQVIDFLSSPQQTEIAQHNIKLQYQSMSQYQLMRKSHCLTL